MLLLVVGAKIFESELASYTMSRLESQIEAPMSIGKVSLIPLFSFPRLSAEINDLWIGEPEGQKGDTLFCIRSLKVGLDTWDLIDGIYTIDKVEISGLDFDYTLDKNGKSNIDFLIYAFVDTTLVIEAIPEISDEAVSKPLDITAENCKLENIRINYYDSLTQMGSQVYIPKITIKGKTKNNIYKGKTEGSVILKHCLFEKTYINKMKSCAVNFELEYEDNIAAINKLSIISEGVNLGVQGNLSLGDTIGIDANLIAKSLDLDILKKYIPNQYLKEYGIINLGGFTDISANIKGKYADSTLLPIIDADLILNGITLQTIEYPEIKTLNLAAHINSGEKSDMSKATINITDLEIRTLESSVLLKGTMNGLKNTRYDISTFLDINLSEFEDYVPDSLAQNLKGNVTASISTTGILPDKFSDDFTDYLANRTALSLNLYNISGLLSDSISIENFSCEINYLPEIFGAKKVHINNLNLKSEPLNVNLQNSTLTAMLTGRFSEPLKMGADLQSFRIQNGNNLIVGSAKINNFEAPEFDINTNILLRLDELMVFVPDSLINTMTGTLKAGIQAKGRIHLDSLEVYKYPIILENSNIDLSLDNIFLEFPDLPINKMTGTLNAFVQTSGHIHPDSMETQLFPLIFENSSLDLTLDNICLEFPDSIMNVDSISANISLRNDELKVDKLSTTYNGLSFKMDSTIVQNIYSAVLLNQKEELYVKTQFEIGDILFDDFKHLMAFGSTNAGPETNSDNIGVSAETSLPDEPQNWTFLIHGKASVNSIIIDSTVLEGFQINRLHIRDLSTLFKLTDSAYIADQFRFKAFEGEMNNSFHYKIRNDGTQSLSAHNVIQNMNIRTLLKDMDNFGMDSVISYENISGILSTDLNTFFPIDDSVLIDKTMVSGDITLEAGGVYDYPPAQELSKFSGIKELDNIQFKTLRSNIFMFKNKLYVPRTNIVCTALDIAAFGMHGLEKDYEYHMEVHLSNILFGKSKKRKNKQDIAGNEIDESTLKKSSRKLIYAEIDGDSKVGWDTRDSRDKMMNKIRVQEKMLGFIFFPKNIHYSTEIDKNN